MQAFVACLRVGLQVVGIDDEGRRAVCLPGDDELLWVLRQGF